MAECPSRFSLMQWRVGELESKDIEDHTAACPACTAALAQIDAAARTCEDRREFNLHQIRDRIEADARPRIRSSRRLPVGVWVRQGLE